jgi:hypothetical protein
MVLAACFIETTQDHSLTLAKGVQYESVRGIGTNDYIILIKTTLWPIIVKLHSHRWEIELGYPKK